MKKDDTCYYMSITKEENSAFVVNQNQTPTTSDPPKEGEYTQCIFKIYTHTNPSVNLINFVNSQSELQSFVFHN